MTLKYLKQAVFKNVMNQCFKDQEDNKGIELAHANENLLKKLHKHFENQLRSQECVYYESLFKNWDDNSVLKSC